MKAPSMFMVVICFSAMTAFAEEGGPGEPPGDGPCKQIRDACEAAGFKRGEHKNKKGLFHDCLKPLMKGEAVAGVAVSAEDLEACKKNKKGRKKMRKMRRHMREKAKGEAQSSAPEPAGNQAE